MKLKNLTVRDSMRVTITILIFSCGFILSRVSFLAMGASLKVGQRRFQPQIEDALERSGVNTKAERPG